MTKEKIEPRKLGGCLHVIALMNVLEHYHVHAIGEEDLVDLLVEGSIKAMRTDPTWQARSFVARVPGTGSRKPEYVGLPDDVRGTLSLLVSQNALSVVQGEIPMYSLTDSTRSDLDSLRKRQEAGLTELIVFVACHSPAQKWAHKHRRDNR